MIGMKINNCFPEVHHIHVKCDDQIFVICHRGGFVDVEELIDQLIKITEILENANA